MDLLSKLSLGFHAALGAWHLLALVCGCLLGLMAGSRRRLSPMSVIALLLPVVSAMDALSAMVMLAAVAYGAAWGPTLADAGELGRWRGLQLRPLLAGAAGAVGTLILILLAQPLATLAFNVGAAENLALMVLALVGAAVLAPGSVLVSLAMAVLGLLMSQLGHRDGGGGFLTGIPYLGAGIPLVPLMIGLFAGAELIGSLVSADGTRTEPGGVGTAPARLSLSARAAAWSALRGMGLGGMLGILPGAGARLAARAARGVEVRLQAGAAGAACAEVAGVAAGHAGSQSAFVPMLLLGVPTSALMALLFAAMAIKGEAAGALIQTEAPEFMWGFCASMWLGSVVLAALGHLPLALGVWISGLSYRWMVAPLLLACCAGAAFGGPTGQPGFSVAVMGAAALASYGFRKLDCQVAPLALAFVLAPHMEGHLRHSLGLSEGDWRAFVDRPASLAMLTLALAVLVTTMLPSVRRLRERVFGEARPTW